MNELNVSAADGRCPLGRAFEDDTPSVADPHERSISKPPAHLAECRTGGSGKYLHSSLLASSAGLGWTAIHAELWSHGVGATSPAASEQVEVGLAVVGNRSSLLRRVAGGRHHDAVADTGMIWLSPAGVSEVVTITAPIPQALHLYLPWSLFDRLNRDFSAPVALVHSIRYAAGIADEVIVRIGCSILSELTDESFAGRVYVEAAAMALAARLLQRYCDGDSGGHAEAATEGLDRVRLRRVLDYIAANVHDDITLAALAGVAGYSPCHFARKFTIAMGSPPHRYVSRLRLEGAMTELACGKLPVAEIALNAQFSSQASFTRAFHRATGMTPKEYQRRRRHDGGFIAHRP